MADRLMRQQKKLAKFLALITGVFLAVMLLPSNTAAAGAKTTLDVSYGSAYIGTGYLDAYSPSGVKVTTPNANGYIITGEAVLKYDKSYQVSVISGTHNIVLDNLKIHNHYDIQSTAFYVAQGATAHITLIGENRLIAPGAGMLVPENATVSITGGAADSLYAQGTHIGAGIGGREATFTSYAFANSGTISIKGGVITAVGTSLAAGIGGGEYGYGGVISISGGTIRATGGGAGIGGGYGGRESIVTKLSVTGGSINTSSMGVTPVNAANQLVYLTTITVPGAVSAQVSALTVRQGSSVVPYSITGMKTDANSKLYLYIPASASRTTADVTVNGVTYPFSGLVSANNANVLKLDQAPFSVSMNSTYTYGDLLSPLTAGGSVSSEPVLTYSGTDGITGAVFANSPQKPVNIGSYTVTAVLPGNETYNDATASSSFSIVKKSISPFFVAAIPDQTYTGSVIAPAVTVIDPDRSITLTANTDYAVSGGAVLVGHAAVTISGSGNYEGSLTRPFTIIPKAISIALSAAPPATTKVGNDITLTAEFLGAVDIPAGTVTFSANGIAFAAGMAFRDASGRYVAIATWNDVPAGSYSLTAHYLAAPADNYLCTAPGQIASYTVTRYDQPDFRFVTGADYSISGGVISKTYGDAPFTLQTAGKLSAGVITYASSDPAVASVDSTGLVTLHKAGTVTLSATSPADDRYLAATATVTLEVAKAAQVGFSFTVSSIDKIYGDAPFTVPLTGLLSSGHVSYAVISGSDVVAIDASSGQITLITSGMATISATSPSDDRYLEATAQLTLSIAKAQQPDFAFNVSSVSKTYGDAPFAVPVAGALSSGDLSFAVTFGDAVGVDAVSGEVTIIKSGSAVVTATQAGDNNYEAAVATVAITVEKATPVPIVFPTSGSITYGMALSSSPLSGGSGDGSFAWLHPETIPSVSNSGYTVVFIPRDTENYDYTGISLEAILPLAVSKAVPDVVFPTASALVYGDSLTRSVLTGGSGDGSFAWLDPEAIPAVVNDGFPVRFTPRDGDNFLPVEQVARVRVTKAAQQPLSLDGVPDAICYADEPFALDVSGGSGTGELRFAVSSGDAVAIDAISGEVTILKAGDAVVTVIKAGDSNHEATSAAVVVTVEKAAPVPVIFPAAGSITYGETLSSSLLSGGSGDGIFAWRYPETEPAVTNSGYTAVFIPRDTENYDYTGISLEATLPLTVNKAVPEVVFPTASALVYGDSLARSVLTGGSSDGSFAWLDPDEIPTVVNDGFLVRFTPRDGDNVLSVEQVVRIRVAKAAQQPLVLSGIPDVVRQTDEPFVLDVSGGSGTGALRFAVSSGDAVAVDSASGEVTILKAGDATVTVSKAGDSNHEAVSASVRILVESAAAQDPEPSPTGIPLGTPSTTPAPTLTPALPARVTPAATVTPEPPDAEPMQIPAVISEDTETGRFMVTVKIADLPAGTTSVQLANGTVIEIMPNEEMIQLEVGQDDLVDGILELRALNAQKPLGSMRIAVAEDFERSPAGGPGTFTVLLWLAAGLALAGLAGLGLVAGKKARRSPKQ